MNMVMKIDNNILLVIIKMMMIMMMKYRLNNRLGTLHGLLNFELKLAA